MKLNARWFPQIVDRDSGNLYQIYIFTIISRIIQTEITRYILAKLALGCDGQSKARNIYSTYKIEFCLESYLTIDMYHKHRIEHTRFRCSSHNLAIEKLRPTHDRVDRVCKYCRNNGITVIEDKHHFLLKCPLYINERSIYIHKYLTYPNDAVFTYLLTSNCHSVVKNVATYIYHANHRRTEYNSVNM